MKHKRIEKMIVLDFYREISPKEKSKLEKHLASCSKCGGFRKTIEKTLSRQRRVDNLDLDRTLREARDEFHRTLLEVKAVPAYEFQQSPRRLVPVPIYAVFAVAFLMLATGVATSYIFLSSRGKNAIPVISELTSQHRNDVAIDNIRFLSTNEKSGEVQFSFDFIKRCEMNGSLDDPDVQKILAYALINSDNPGVRLKTVGMLDAAVSTTPDKEIENALLKSVRTDDNAGVRRAALLSLKKMSFDNEIKSALLSVLQADKNPGMRVLAINYLSEKEMAVASVGSQKIDPKVLNVLKEKSLSDQNKYVRLKAAGMLKEIAEL